MGITYGKLLFCHVISEESMDKKISTIEYNDRTVYEWFNNPFIADFYSPDLNLPPITIGDRTNLQKEPSITQICYQLPYLFTLKFLLVIWQPLLIFHGYFSYLLMILNLPMQQRKTSVTVAWWKEDTALGNNTQNDTKKRVSIAPRDLIKTIKCINVIGFPGLIQRQWISSWNINILRNKD